MQNDPNFDYIIATYIVTLVLLVTLAAKIIISYKKQKKISDESRNETQA